MDTAQDLKTDAMNPESKYTSCPYNHSHRILRARVQYHLVKCKRTVKEKPEEEKSICPFDATHHVDKAEFEEHVKTCPNRKIVDSEKYAIESEEKKDDEPAASYTLPDLPPCEENWDDPSEPAYTYNPQTRLENQPILRTMHGGTRSERKAFRMVERMKMVQFNSGQPMDTEAAAAAAGVTIPNGRYAGNGYGNPKPLAHGNSSVEKVDLNELVGDGVGLMTSCTADSPSLRSVSGFSVTYNTGKSGEEPTPSEDFPPLPSSTRVTREMPSPVRKEEKRATGKGQRMESRNQGESIDWWEPSGPGLMMVGNEGILENYKEMKKNLQLASKMGVIEADRDDDTRAKAFTYEDREWQVQGRRRGRGVQRRGYARNY